MYAGISHDLKTPLAVIHGYLEQIQYGVIHEPEEIRETMQQVLQKTERLNKLIDDIMLHEKAELNQLTIEKQGIYADVYFRELMKEYQKEASVLAYTLDYNLPGTYQLELDTLRIAQVMQNILGNAVKYRKENLTVTVRFEEELQPVRLLIVSVTDNGIGIDAADLPFVFDLFFRGSNTKEKDIHGSGMGLHIAKYIVEQHGGQIECDSIAGSGTRISFSLPVI